MSKWGTLKLKTSKTKKAQEHFLEEQLAKRDEMRSRIKSEHAERQRIDRAKARAESKALAIQQGVEAWGGSNSTKKNKTSRKSRKTKKHHKRKCSYCNEYHKTKTTRKTRKMSGGKRKRKTTRKTKTTRKYKHSIPKGWTRASGSAGDYFVYNEDGEECEWIAGKWICGDER